jgi:hypothetical protein
MNRATVGCLLILLLLGVSPVWGALISVGNHNLLPDTGGQAITISVSGGESVDGLDFFLQVADGGPELGGSIDGPRIANADIFTGTIFAGNNAGELGGGSLAPQFWQSGTVTDSGYVSAAGLLATVLIDTSGFVAGAWELKMADTLMGDSRFPTPGIDTVVENGSISIESGQRRSNASFEGDSDVDALPIDLGTVALGDPMPVVSFSIWNLDEAPDTPNLDLDTIVGAGDTSTLMTDLAPFVDLPRGSFNSFTAFMDTSTVGSFNATYTLSFSDVTGLPQPDLVLSLTGSVVPEPSALLIWSSLGGLGLAVAAWRRRRSK